jgi:MFS family permease
MKSNSSKGYIQLLKSNRPFRNLWYGQVVSELGDWLNSIAIYALILQLTGSGMAMAAAMMAKLLPIFFVSPVAGVMIDRMDRRRVMIISDILRFGIVLGFLLVDEKDELWLVYTLTVLEITLSGFFEPARSALIPSIIAREHLVTANALSGSTWSMMLAFGAALGGVVVSLFGIRTAFIIDAFTFLLSAWFISRIQENKTIAEAKPESGRQGGFKDLVEGLRYLASRPIVLVLALLKSGLAIAGGIMTLIPLYANHLLSTPAAVSLGTGILYCSRGIGAAVGPILVTRIFGDSSSVLRIAISAGFFLSAGSAVLFGYAHSMWTASLTIGLLTLFGSIIWVFSSAMIHLEAEGRFLGRIFSTEMGLLTLVMGASNWAVGYAVDRVGLTPNEVSVWMAGFLLIPGVLWTVFTLLVHKRLKQEPCLYSECPVDPSGFNPIPSNPLKKSAENQGFNGR